MYAGIHKNLITKKNMLHLSFKRHCSIPHESYRKSKSRDTLSKQQKGKEYIRKHFFFNCLYIFANIYANK